MLDNFRRKLFLKNELKRFILKSIIKNTNIPITYRYFALYNKSKLVIIFKILIIQKIYLIIVCYRDKEY